MNLAIEAPQWLALLLSALLVAAAVEDAIRLRISNITVLLVLIGAIVAAVLVGPEISLWKNLVVFLGLLAVGTPMFAAGKLGGGDVKLLAAAGLWFDFAGGLWMLICVAIAGGVLALIVIALRAFGWSEGCANASSCSGPRPVSPMALRSLPERSSQWRSRGCDLTQKKKGRAPLGNPAL
ncbi:prepilin peptidase [Sphingomonas sediminicola]|uniref:Prepilin peptidase n=1 Tax=Sphingomonas sediminicola TaxID=386874 RepID=A0ABX6T8N6_9SPHN|nr:prepilin peptidase [Sphingomonas sediminicola]QNP46211.1 prepilin peptidase [Sphingomonas sediminicola]